MKRRTPRRLRTPTVCRDEFNRLRCIRLRIKSYVQYMRIPILLPLLASTFLATSAAGASVEYIDNGRGPVPLYLPSSYDESKPLPLVISLHGYSDPGVEAYFDFVPQVDVKEFLYCVPTGTADSSGSRSSARWPTRSASSTGTRPRRRPASPRSSTPTPAGSRSTASPTPAPPRSPRAATTSRPRSRSTSGSSRSSASRSGSRAASRPP